MIRFPLRYARRNIIIGPAGEAAALYRVDVVSYRFLPAAEKWALLHRLEHLLTLLGADVSIWRVTRAYPADRYAASLAALADPRFADAEKWDSYVATQQARLKGLDYYLPEVYLGVSLKAEGAGSILRAVDRGRRRVEALAGVDGPRPIGAGELRSLAEAEQYTFERAGSVLSLRRASTAELQWLLRRASCRGVAEPDLDQHWAPDAMIVSGGESGEAAYQPLEAELWSLVNAPVLEDRAEPPSLFVEAEEGVGYQAFLCFGQLAEEAEFPGGAELLFAPLEGVGPVDAVLHADNVANKEALAQVRRRVLDAEHSYWEEAAGSPSGPRVVAEEDRELAREYEAALSSTARPPMLRAWVSLAVGARTREELERRVADLRERYGDLALYRPRGLQHALYMDHLPRADGGALGDYRRQMTVEQVAAMVPVATAEVGSAGGVYIGYEPSTGRPVRYDPTEAPRESRPSAVLLTGTLGSGKTIAAQTIAHAALLRGSLIIDFDPKPDHRLGELPEFADQAQLLELSADPEHRGKLDPLEIGLPELREELVSSYLLELLRQPPPSWEVAIDRAVRDAVRAGDRSLGRIVDRLRAEDSRETREAADALEVIADFGLARLGFSEPKDGEDSPLTDGEPNLITIRMPGLNLPEPGTDRAAYTRSERVSVATLALVASLALKLISSDRSRHKLVVLDEAWALFASSEGRSLLNRLVRLARAFNATILLITQEVGDLGELAKLVGVIAAFGQDSLEAAERSVEEIGLDPAENGLAQRLRSFRHGRCLKRDLAGRVGEVQFDPHPELLAALDNTPGAPVR